MYSFPFQRVVIVGVTGCGKSTLAEKLATLHGLPFVELDALYWGPQWQPVPLETFRERVARATKGPAWIVAGNYSKARDLVWPRAEALIWLDYSFPRVLGQLTRRTFGRWWNRELLWGTNRESLWKQFRLWSDESLYHWLCKTYVRHRREYPGLLAQPEHRHLQVLRFTSPAETMAWWKEWN